MSSIPINPIIVQGAWRLGWTLDVHTTSSEFLGYDPDGRPLFETTRSPLGELLYQLKYRGQPTVGRIATIMAGFFKNKPIAMARINLIVPMPSSTPRPVQPVVQIAAELAKKLKKPFATDAIRKIRKTPGLKDVHDPEQRRELLDRAFEADPKRVHGQGVLLVDDLYRSGATANAVTVALMQAGATRVYLRSHPHQEPHMICVFIGGSRRVGLVNAELAQRLDNIMARHLRVVIGDANGFDRAAQSYLAARGYRDVLIYCTAGECRNNVGHWPLHAVPYAGRDHGLAFFTAKDDAMLRDADYGLFAWDAKSKGTLRNIQKMAEQAKPSAVYIAPLKKFLTVRNAQDAAALNVSTPTQAAPSADLFSDQLPAASQVGAC